MSCEELQVLEVSFNVAKAEPPAGDALTATFQDVPDAHGGPDSGPVRDTLKVTLNVASGWSRLHARAGDLWRLLRVPAPPTGRGR